MKIPERKICLLTLAPAFFVITTIIGAYRWFSPVPFWDMWDGYVTFNLNANLSGLRVLWAQANEHRIILSELLFWLDWHVFGGMSRLLIPANLVFMLGLWASAAYAAISLMASNKALAYVCSMLAGVLCFSWLQSENITWGYQSQFFLAYLLPLMAFISMAVWLRSPQRSEPFAFAVALAMLSTITMANGLSAPFFLIAMLALSGHSTVRRMGFLIATTAVTLFIWMFHYVIQPEPRVSLLGMTKFVFIFLGGPFMRLFHNRPLGYAAGATVVGSGIYFAYCWLSGLTRDPMFLAITCFLAYVGAASVAAATGRGFAGVDAAGVSRYQTPVLLAYVAIALLFSHLNRDRSSTVPVLSTLLVCASLVLYPTQLTTLDSSSRILTRDRLQAALALDLGVNDPKMFGNIYPADVEWRVASLKSEAQPAIRENASVFGQQPLKIARDAIGKSQSALAIPSCEGSIDITSAIDSDPNYVRVEGWAFNATTRKVPQLVFLVTDGIITGAAIPGIDRPDVRKAIHPKAEFPGFQGYNEASSKKASLACWG